MILCVIVVHLFKDATVSALSFTYMQTCVLKPCDFLPEKSVAVSSEKEDSTAIHTHISSVADPSELPCCLLRQLN